MAEDLVLSIVSKEKADYSFIVLLKDDITGAKACQRGFRGVFFERMLKICGK
jgi:hypothetical protein